MHTEHITELAAKAWFDKKFKNLWFLTRVVCTHSDQDWQLYSTGNYYTGVSEITSDTGNIFTENCLQNAQIGDICNRSTYLTKQENSGVRKDQLSSDSLLQACIHSK